MKQRKSLAPASKSSASISSIISLISPSRPSHNSLCHKSLGPAINLRIKYNKNPLLSPPNASLDSSLVSIKGHLPKIDNNEKPKISHTPEYYKKKLKKLLSKAPDNTDNADERFVIFINIYNEVARNLAPYTEILEYLKENIINLAKNEMENKKLLNTIDDMNKEKNLMNKRLNSLNEELERSKNESELLYKKLKHAEKFSKVNYEELVESSLKKTEILEQQKAKIQELTVNLVILKKTLDKLKSSGVDVLKAIGEVDDDLSTPFYIG
jgi:predicted  nucleic acid-binding Zn-ribbon protein